MISAREERLLERLERALAVRGTQTVSDMLTAALHWARREGVASVLMSGVLDRFPGLKLVLVTEVEDYPQFRVLRYATVAGDMNEEDLIALQARADAWGREQGCTRAEAIGRPGWDRKATQWLAGWNRVGSFWAKDLRQ